MNTARRRSLLCELHAHTTWSDGALSVRELVDLYGAAGFDVLCVTDHVVREPFHQDHIHAGNYAGYVAEIRSEAARAHDLCGLLVMPGLELTYDAEDPEDAAHVVAVGLTRFVDVRAGIDAAVRDAGAAGAALIGAHPYAAAQDGPVTRETRRFERDRDWARGAVDRFELFNRHELFAWVAEERLPAVACGDFHVPAHLSTWKTGLPCAKDADDVVDFLRSRRPAHLVEFSTRVPVAA